MRHNNQTQTDQGLGAEAVVETNGKSRKVRAGLAGLTVLGLGLAATTALFTDNVLFGGDVAVAEAGQGTFQLQGAVTQPGDAPSSWTDAAASRANEIPLDLGTLQPGQANEVWLWVQDASGGDLTSVSAVVDGTLPPGVSLANTGGTVEFTAAGGDGVWKAPLTLQAESGASAGEGTITIDVTAQGEGSDS